MSALSGVPPYWLNFLLHTALLSTFVWVGCLLIRDPGRRAFAAAAGVFAVTVIPWFSALRPFTEVRTRVMEMAPISGQESSGWTIRLEEATALVAQSKPVVSSKPMGISHRIAWEKAALLLWIGGAAVEFGMIAMRQWRLFRWDAGNRTLTDREWQAVSQITGLRRERIRSCNGVGTPCVVGFFRSRVIIPGFLLGSPADTKLAWALRHEAEHLRSGDSRLAVLLACTAAVMWWNPFVRSLCGRWAEDRERVCDARATEDGARRREYAKFLLDLSERLPGTIKGAVPMAGSATARRMKKRLQAVLRGDRVKDNPLVFRVASCLLMGCAGLLAAFTGIERAGAVEGNPPVAEKPATPVEEAAAPFANKPDDTATPAVLPEVTSAPSQKGDEVKPMPPYQVKLTSKLILSREANPQAGKILDDAQVQMMMSELSAVEGVALVTTPSAVAKRAQKAIIEIIREGPKLPHAPPDPTTSRDSRFLGLSLEFIPHIAGDRISLAIDCSFNFPPGAPTLKAFNPSGLPPVPKDFDWTTVKSASAKTTAELKSGETLVVAFEGMEAGWHLTGLFSVYAIDATGRAFDASGKLVPGKWEEPLVWRDGSVTVRGAIVELPRSGRLPSYWFAIGGELGSEKAAILYPGSHMTGIAREAREAGGKRNWTDLGTATASGGPPITLWKDFPVQMEVKRSQRADCQIRLKLPDEPEEIELTGYLGNILGILLQPTPDGRRRFLLLALSEPEP